MNVPACDVSGTWMFWKSMDILDTCMVFLPNGFSDGSLDFRLYAQQTGTADICAIFHRNESFYVLLELKDRQWYIDNVRRHMVFLQSVFSGAALNLQP